MSPTANDAWHQNGVQGAVEMDLIVAPLGSNLEYRWVSLVNLTMPGFPSESQCWGTYVSRCRLLMRRREEEEQQASGGKNYGTDPHLYASELGDALKPDRWLKNRSLP